MAKQKSKKPTPKPAKPSGGLITSFRSGIQRATRGDPTPQKRSVAAVIFSVLLWVAVIALLLWRFGALPTLK